MSCKTGAEAARPAGERLRIAATMFAGFARIAIRLEKAWAKALAFLVWGWAGSPDG